MAPMAVKTAKARLWPTLPIRRGAHQHPIKKPKKCMEPRKPTSPRLKPFCNPVSASSGPTPPDESCNNTTDKKRAAKEISIRMRP